MISHLSIIVCFVLAGIVSSFNGHANRPMVPRRELSMGLRSRIKRIFRGENSVRTDDELKSGIAKFYDESSGIWLDVWGEHMHHGYYPYKGFRDHEAAQIGMIDRSLGWAYGTEAFTAAPKTMVDVGCGVGGSSRYICRRYGCDGVGVSLSPFQIGKAKEFTVRMKEEGKLQPGQKVEYEVADAMKMPFKDGAFDLTWSMESGEHMPDKRTFMKELCRVTAPDGRIIVVTWCHRELREGEDELPPKELKLLRKISKAYYLPDWVPVSDYVALAKEFGLEGVKSDDWSGYIAPFWRAVMFSALSPRNFLPLLRTGSTTIKGALATLLMLRGFQKGTIKFALITGKKGPQK